MKDIVGYILFTDKQIAYDFIDRVSNDLGFIYRYTLPGCIILTDTDENVFPVNVYEDCLVVMTDEEKALMLDKLPNYKSCFD